jgi:hypothetical protein
MEIAAAGTVYGGYSYRYRADRFIREFKSDEAGRLREAAKMVHFNSLRDQLQNLALGQVDLLATRYP